ncbi:MAG: DUF1616 domain-containing protein [Candidatus Bathyarchaeota archaeon]|nr:DUF1616 domain-containing protein [Candidatus Bathyarchaeota archaeon]
MAQTLSLKDDKDSYVIAVAVALLLSAVLLGYYYIAVRTPTKEYLTLYLLNTQRRAEGYPELLVLGENNTISVYVNVENHMNTSHLCEVQIKVTRDVSPMFPLNTTAIQTFRETLQVGAKLEKLTTVSLDQIGNFSVVFELWVLNELGVLEFSGEFCVLNVRVINSTGN